MAYDDIFAKDTNSRDDAQIIEVMLRDSSTGAGKTGLAYDDVTCYYTRQGAAGATEITLCAGVLGTYTNSGAAGTGGGFIEVDDENAKGLYQFSIPDAVLASGANSVTLNFQGTGVIDCRIRILLVASDLRTAYITAGTGSGQLNVSGGRADADVVYVGGEAESLADLKDFADTGYDPSTHTVAEVALLTGHTPQTGDAFIDTQELLTRVPDATPGEAGGLPTVDADNKVAGVQGDTPQTGDVYDLLTAGTGVILVDHIVVSSETDHAVVLKTTQDEKHGLYCWSAGLSGHGLSAVGQAASIAVLNGIVGDLSGSVNDVVVPVMLDEDYDAAKTAASQDSVDAVASDVTAVKGQTDKFSFTGDDPYEVKADVVDWNGSAAPAMSGDAYARLGEPVGESISADIASVQATAGGAETAASEAKTAAEAAPAGAADAILAQPANKLATDGEGRVTVGGIELDPDAIAGALLDALLAEHAISGSVGKALTDVLARTIVLAGGRIQYIGPVRTDGQVFLVRGDDYILDKTIPIRHRVENYVGPDPGVEGVTCVFSLGSAIAGRPALVTAPARATLDGTTLLLEVDISGAETTGLDGSYMFDYQLCLPGGFFSTVLLGRALVLPDVSEEERTSP